LLSAFIGDSGASGGISTGSEGADWLETGSTGAGAGSGASVSGAGSL